MTPGEVERVICEVAPRRPSTALSQYKETGNPGETRQATPDDVSRARNTSREKLRRRLSGDLDTIVLKALQKDPARRYASAEQLLEDIRRHLTGLPVLAQPDTLSYRTSKFIRRQGRRRPQPASIGISTTPARQQPRQLAHRLPGRSNRLLCYNGPVEKPVDIEKPYD